MRKSINLPAIQAPPRGASSPYARPEWVILGAPQPDGQVMVFASKKLDRAELEAKFAELEEVYTPFLDDPIWLSRPRYFLRVEMPEFVMIVADTYEQALRSLFEQWAPEPDRPALDRAP